ncbi:VanZ family protein [Halorientalis halophila]|uniref:VanZ family protein n=1 Tax=Halorientalis halophila TaxID=3108499 RepID=UPI0030089BE1
MGSLRVPLLPSWVRWLAVALVAAVVVWSSVTRPPTGGPGPAFPGPIGFDKYLHIAAYLTLTGALGYALVDGRVERIAALAFAVAVSFGFGVELLQLASPYRSFSFGDAVANAVGASVVAALWGPLTDRVRFRPLDKWRGSRADR